MHSYLVSNDTIHAHFKKCCIQRFFIHR